MTGQLLQRVEYVSRLLLFVVVAALPIWFISAPIGVEFGREVTIGILIIVLLMVRLLAVLLGGDVRLRISAVLWSGIFYGAIVGLATLFSKAPLISFYLGDSSTEKFATLLLGVALMVLAGSTLRSRGEVAVLALIGVLAGGLTALATALQLLFDVSVYSKIASFAQGVDFNPVGTINGLSLYLAALFIMGLALVTSSSFRDWKPAIRWALGIALALFLLDLLLINYQISWMVLLGSSIFYFGLMFKNLRSVDSERRMQFNWNYALAGIILALSIVMIFMRSPVIKQTNLPSEVSPALRSTLSIAGSVYKEGFGEILLGSGPGTFGFEWGRYKDPAVNTTIFWSVRFNQGYSWVSTVLATTGILGTAALLVLFLTAVGIFIRALLLSAEAENGITIAVFLAFISCMISAFLYPANFALVMLFFLTAGLLSQLGSKKHEPQEPALVGVVSGEENAPKRIFARCVRAMWEIREQPLRFESQWGMFFSSLTIIFLLAVSIGGLYGELGRMRSAFAFQSGVAAFNAGDLEKSTAEFERASRIQSRDYKNYLALLQIHSTKIKQLIQQASQGRNVQNDFQTTIAQAIQEGQTASGLYPLEPGVWRAIGNVYEIMIPFVAGSERFAFDNYRKATELEPANPSIWVDLGRAGLIYADRLFILLSQSTTTGQDRAKIEKERTLVLEESAKAFQRAIDTKSDYAQAHFLLSQAAIRAGNLQLAIQSTENAKLTAPFDVGVAFQLGLLYYQAGNLDKSQAEFDRAVSYNENYSNARYFLGLIYDRKGERDKAIEQFVRIQALNPDNQEVRAILANLTAKRAALTGIVPPAEPPEKRKETPVREDRSRR